MTLLKVAFSAEAWGTVQRQAQFIAVDRQSPLNAARWLDRLLEAVDTLERLPDRFAVDPAESAAIGVEVYRLVFERTYLLFYIIDEPAAEVTIVAFRHGAPLGKR